MGIGNLRFLAKSGRNLNNLGHSKTSSQQIICFAFLVAIASLHRTPDEPNFKPHRSYVMVPLGEHKLGMSSVEIDIIIYIIYNTIQYNRIDYNTIQYIIHKI